MVEGGELGRGAGAVRTTQRVIISRHENAPRGILDSLAREGCPLGRSGRGLLVRVIQFVERVGQQAQDQHGDVMVLALG